MGVFNILSFIINMKICLFVVLMLSSQGKCWKPEIYLIQSMRSAENTVTLNWIYPATLHEYFSYVIKYKPTNSKSFKEVVRDKLESYEVKDLLPDTEYEFYVFIKDYIDGAQLPRMSSPAVITTESWGKELSKPKIFKIEVEDATSVDIQWYYPLRFQKFVIKYRPTKSESNFSKIDLPFNHINITEKIGKSFVKLENLSPNTEYEFYVCPENDPKNEKPYSRAVITTQEYWKPEIYSINSLDTADNAVALKWIYPATLHEYFSYVIKYKPTYRTSFKEVVRTKIESDEVINLLPDTEYEFYVFIKDYIVGAPLPRMSSPAVITTRSWGKELSKPKIFKIEVEQDTSVVIRWYYPLRFQKFVIKYKPTKSETTISEIDLPFNHIKITEKIGKSFVKLENLSPNTEYEFYVCPENDPENEKPYSRAVITTQGSKDAPHHGTNGLSNRQ